MSLRRILAALVAAISVTALALANQTAFASGPPARARAGATRLGPRRVPHVLQMHGHGKVFDVRHLQQLKPRKRERAEDNEPFNPNWNPLSKPATDGFAHVPVTAGPAPAPNLTFAGLDYATWGGGHPPDTNGDVGPSYYIETVNTSIGIFDKSTGALVSAFTFDTFMSQGSFGNLCDTDNFGDPVVLYDTFEDRWFITDFAFQLDGSGNVVNPPGVFQCMAVSKTGDPVNGGWNFYSLSIAGGLDDYPKFGIWPDGIYFGANMFGYSAGAAFVGPRVYALDKAEMYAGAPTVDVVSFDGPSADFTLLPSNARLQTGTPPAGSPDYFVGTWEYTNALTVYKLHVDWNRISTSTFTGPDVPLAATSWSSPPSSVPSQGGNNLDTLAVRAMMQNQYSNIGGVESLWDSHTVAGSSSSQSAVRYYQVNVTGGAVGSNLVQAATYNPTTTMNRFMPSVDVDRAGDMALGYSTTSSTSFPAIKYAGRLAGDPVNTITQTEQAMFQGTGTQTGNCGSSACIRWGDYSAMTLDTDGCTFWYANEYYATTGLDDQTRIGNFDYPSCSPVGNGTLSGTVTQSGSGTPISGAMVALGARTTTTASDGTYSFSVPAGTYPTLTVSANGFTPASASSIAVSSGGTTTHDVALSAAPASGSFVDTSQADFQTGVPSNTDLVASAGDVVLASTANVDQQNQSVTTNGFGFTSTAWAGQTFKAGVTGQLTRADMFLFCSSCTGTTPNITVSLRATTGSPAVPTGADLATATIPGFSSGAGGYFSANFSSPATVTAGTKYALVVRPVSNPSAGTYAYVCSCGTIGGTNPYANGQRVTSSNSGSTWTADTTAGGRDLGFITYVKTGYATSGTFVSSVKDADPASGLTPTWGTLSWTAATPAGTTLTFQAGASNSPYGPFSFVGPDGTSGTTFSNGASLAEFNGMRYLRYRATLSTSNTASTPSLHDVTIGFTDAGSGADVSITDADSPDPITADATLTYTLTVANAGPQNATSVSVADPLPSTVTFVSTTTSQGSCSGSSTVSCSLGTINSGGHATVTIKVSPLQPGSISSTATVSATQSDPNTANNSATASTTVNAQSKTSYVSLTDTGFAKTTLSVAQGTTVQWNVLGPTANGVADNSGMGLFDSGTLAPVNDVRFKFTAAGQYKVVDKLGHAETVTVAVKAAPASGTTSTSFTITWASAAPAAGFVVDVQIERPGTTSFVNWLTNQTATNAVFVPDAGTGTYKFRARLRKTSDNSASSYSGAKAITVS